MTAVPDATGPAGAAAGSGGAAGRSGAAGAGRSRRGTGPGGAGDPNGAGPPGTAATAGMAGVRIERAGPADAGQILTVQRAAYVTEAQLHGDPFLPPLVESLGQLRKAIGESVVLKATDGARLVGAVRGRFNDRTCLVGRLAVVPDLQGRGIGSALLRAIEAEAAGLADACVLFTGHLSDANLRLYRRLGYAETHRERVADHLMLVHMRKPLPGR